MTEHLKMNAIYWGLSVLDLLDALPTGDDVDKIMDFVMKSRNSDGISPSFCLPTSLSCRRIWWRSIS
jgi:hypothetical protein